MTWLLAGLTHIDFVQLLTAMVPIGVSLAEHLLPGGSIAFRRLLVALAVLSLLIFGFYTYFRTPKVNEALFVVFLFVWGGAVYSVIVELLRVGLGVWLSGASKSNRWIRRFEYPCLFFTILGLLVTINRLPVMEGAIPNVDLIGPVILMTAATIKFAKTRAEIGDWHLLDDAGWKKIW